MSGSPLVLKVPVTQLEADPDQVRTLFGEAELEGLGASLRERQLYPLLVYRKKNEATPPTYRVIDGGRRLLAAQRAGLAALDVLVVEEPKDRGELLTQQLVSCLQRQDLSPMEKARGIEQLAKETGWTQAQVAAALGMTRSNVSKLTALLAAAPELQARVAAGEISGSTAYQITRSGDAEAQALLAAEVAGQGLTRDAVARRVRRPEAHKSKARVASRIVAQLSGGRAVGLSGPGLDSVERVIEWLEELLAKARRAKPRGMELSTFAALLRDEAKRDATSEAGGAV